MPFDGFDYVPKRPVRADNAVSIFISISAAALLLLPFSVASFIDLVKFIAGP